MTPASLSLVPFTMIMNRMFVPLLSGRRTGRAQIDRVGEKSRKAELQLGGAVSTEVAPYVSGRLGAREGRAPVLRLSRNRVIPARHARSGARSCRTFARL